jgi:hypothetical protein
MGVHLTPKNPLKHCRTCDLTFNTRSAAEVAHHQQLHSAKRKAWQVLTAPCASSVTS